MAYMCVRDIAGLQICGCDACRAEKGWTPNDPPAAGPPQLARLTSDGDMVMAPLGTSKCAQTIGRPHPGDLTHRLFAPDNPGPAVQLMTYCGRRAHRFVLESEGKDVDCPECLANE